MHLDNLSNYQGLFANVLIDCDLVMRTMKWIEIFEKSDCGCNVCWDLRIWFDRRIDDEIWWKIWWVSLMGIMRLRA